LPPHPGQIGVADREGDDVGSSEVTQLEYTAPANSSDGGRSPSAVAPDEPQQIGASLSPPVAQRLADPARAHHDEPQSTS